MTRDFRQWHTVKQRLDSSQNPPTFNEREIWWCSVGLNVGYEIFGKDEIFTRPVLVVRKFSPYTFLGVPMTTGQRTGYFRYPYSVKGRDGFLLFDQTRTYDSRRLADMILKVHPNDFEKIKRAMKTRLNL